MEGEGEPPAAYSVNIALSPLSVPGASSSSASSQSSSYIDTLLKQKLCLTAQNQLKLFEEINKWWPIHEMSAYASTYAWKPTWTDMICDYENYIAVIANDLSSPIEIPLELELIWRVHMSSPKLYYSDCIRRFGKLIPHSSSDPCTTYKRHNSPRFRESVKPLNDDVGFLSHSKTKMTQIIADHLKFVSKMITINGDRNKNPITIDQINLSVTRYDRFLQCAFESKNEFCMAPTLDILFIWNSHSLDPQNYWQFCLISNPKKELLSLSFDVGSACDLWNSKFGDGDFMNGRAFYVTPGVNGSDVKPERTYASLNRKQFMYYFFCWTVIVIVIGVVLSILIDVYMIILFAVIWGVVIACVGCCFHGNKCNAGTSYNANDDVLSGNNVIVHV